jgi:hypothetical protein
VITVRLLVDGAVVREAVFREGPVLLGRGPESDFVIPEPSVSRRHARVCQAEDGSVWIEDGGSRNGVRIGGAPVTRAPLPARGALRCQLGAAEVEIALPSAEATLELALPPPPPRGSLRVLVALAFWALAVAAPASGMLTSPGFWSPWDQNRPATLAGITMGVAVGVPILAFLLIGLLRIVRRRARLTQTLRALALVGWGWVLLTALTRASWYLLSVQAQDLLASALAVAGVAVSVAYLASTARRGPLLRFFLAWAAVVVLVTAGVAGAGQLAARQSGTPQVDYDMEVPIAGWSGPGSSLDAYLADVRADYDRAERRAADERRYSDAARR